MYADTLITKAPLLVDSTNFIVWRYHLVPVFKILHLYGIICKGPVDEIFLGHPFLEDDLNRISALIRLTISRQLQTEYHGVEWDNGVILWEELERRFGASGGARHTTWVAEGRHSRAQLLNEAGYREEGAKPRYRMLKDGAGERTVRGRRDRSRYRFGRIVRDRRQSRERRRGVSRPAWS